MKKFLSFALIGLLVAGLFVSCSSDVENEKISYGLCSVDFDANSKGLQVTVDGNLATSGSDGFFWSYKATKLDSYGKEGEKTSITKFYDDTTTKGLAKLENLSTGKWKFELFAFLDGARSKQVYDGSIEVVLSANVENAIAVPMKRSQIAGKKGTLVIDPAKVNIAYDAGTVVVTNEDGESYVDEHALKQKFGVLSDYSYWVYECDEYWKELTTLTDSGAENKETFTAKYSEEFEPGLHYIKIKISEAGKNDANVYLAMLKVNIYSNCTTEILDDGSGDNSGIVVKRLKEFKITYYEGKDTTIGYATDEKREVGVHPESKGTHSNVESDFTPEGEDVYPQYHQYGRSELLDVPKREGYGFVGWYDNYNCTGDVYKFISAYECNDIVLYAKWGELKYTTVVWDDNWPIDYKGVSYTGKTPATTGNAARITHSTDGSISATFEDINSNLSTAKSPTVNPVCPGYIFKGWYYDDKTYNSPIMTLAGSLLPLPEAQIEKRIFKAKWEPVTYKIHFKLDSTGKPSDASFGDHLEGVAYSGNVATIDAKFGVSCLFNDATSSLKGFLGWSLIDGDTGANKTVDNDNILNIWDANEVPYQGKDITLYAAWSDLFVPLDYIRSYPASATGGPYIDTGLKYGTGAGYWTDIDMTIEWAGEPKTTAEVFAGANDSIGWDIGLCGYTLSTSVRDGKWRFIYPKGGVIDTGVFFEDEKIEIKGHAGADGSYMVVNGDVIVKNTSVKSETGTRNLYLFAGNNNGTVNWCSDIRLYSCKIYNSNGELERKFVPCKIGTAGISASYSSDGVAKSGGLVGLWDLRTNKFYPAKTGSFKQPSDEVIVTFDANGGNGEQRKQRVLKGVSEKLHGCIFSNDGCAFTGWITDRAHVTVDYEDRLPVTVSDEAGLTLYAKWSVPISWHLFGQVEWIELCNAAYILTNQKVSTDAVYSYLMEPTRLTATTGWAASFGARDGWVSTYATNAQKFSLFIKCQPTSAVKYAWYDSLGKGTGDNEIIKCEYGVSVGNRYQVNMNAKEGFIHIKSEGSSPYDKTWTFGAGICHTNEATIALNSVGVAKNANGTNSSIKDPNSNLYVDTNSNVVGNDFKYYWAKVEVGGKELFNLVPCVLSEDLISTKNVYDSKTKTNVAGNKKVYGERNCSKGSYGMWDLVGDVFYPWSTLEHTPAGSANIPTDKYLMRYDANGGIGTMADQEINSGDNVALCGCRFKRPGYEFIGWTDFPDATTAGTKWYSDGRVLHSYELRNVTLFAQWRQIPATVQPFEVLDDIWNDKDESHAYIDTGVTLAKAQGRIVYSYMKDVNLAVPTVGSSGNETGNIDGTTMSVGTSTFTGSTTPKVSQVLNTIYDVDVYWNGTKGIADVISNALDAQVINKSITSNAGTGTLRLFRDDSSSVSYGGVHIYSARIYDENDRLVRDYVPVVLTQDASDVKGILRPKGTIGMWDKQNNKFYANAISGSGYFVSNNICTITFKPNGGSGSMDIQAFKIGDTKVALHTNVFTMAGGKKFIGWNTKSDGTGIWYHDKYETNAWKGGALTLYAQWEKTAGSVSTDFFEPLNYIKGDGTSSYIDTGWKNKDGNFETYIVMNPNNLASGYFFGQQGTDASTATKNAQLIFTHNGVGKINVGNHWVYVISGKPVKATDFNDIMFKANGGKLSINGTEYTAAFTFIDTTSYAGSFTIFGCRTVAGDMVGFSGCSVSYCKIIDNGTVVCELIPCRLIKKIGAYEAGSYSVAKTTHKVGEIGFWDLKNNKFYGNHGSGVLTCELN